MSKEASSVEDTEARSAMKLALDALDDIKDDCSGCEFEWSNDYPLQAKAKLALEEALAKQEQGEPHSWYSAQEDEWMTEKTRKDHERLNSYTHKVGGFDLPLYTTPQQPSTIVRTWVGLTDEDKVSLCKQFPLSLTYNQINAIEAKLKEKNT